MHRLDALHQIDRRRRALELSLALGCALLVALGGLRAWGMGYEISGPALIVAGLGLAIAAVRQRVRSRLGPGVVAARIDRGGESGEQVGLILTAHEAATGRAQGSAELLAHTIALATEALAAVDERRAVPALRWPWPAALLVGVAALLQPLSTLGPAASAQPAARAGVQARPEQTTGGPLEGTVLGALVEAARPVVDPAAPGAGGPRAPSEGGAAEASAAAGGAGQGSGAGGGLGVADPSATAGEGDAEGGGLAQTGATEAPPPEPEAGLERPDVASAVQLLDKGRSAVNDGEDAERGAESGEAPRQDAAGAAEGALKGGEVQGSPEGPSGGDLMNTESAPEQGDQPSEAGGDGPAVDQPMDGPQVQDLDDRVTWETPGGRPGQGGANDAAGTDSRLELGDATAVEAEDERLSGARSGGSGGTRAETEDGQNAYGEANDTEVGRAAAAEAEAGRGPVRPPAARRAWLAEALAEPAAAAPDAPTAAAPPPQPTTAAAPPPQESP